MWHAHMHVQTHVLLKMILTATNFGKFRKLKKRLCDTQFYLLSEQLSGSVLYPFRSSKTGDAGQPRENSTASPGKTCLFR